MNSISNKNSRPIYLLLGLAIAALALVLLVGVVPAVFGNSTAVNINPPGTPLNVGYLGFSWFDPADPGPIGDPTGEKPQSKLWWNDGFWWGSMYNPKVDADAFHIYKLHMGTQTWVDTGVKLDDVREPGVDPKNVKADTLWDAANNKLYVVSHVYADNPSPVNNAVNFGRLFSYTYDPLLQTYTKDTGFPVTVNKDKTETLVVDKDSTGRLWVTYVSKASKTAPYQVYVNNSLADDLTWDEPFPVPMASGEELVDQGDISTLVAFEDKIAVLWSNQSTGNLNLAIHAGNDPKTGWTHNVIPLPAGTTIDDHLNVKSLAVNASGQLFAVVKLSDPSPAPPIPDPKRPDIVVAARDTNGSFSTHTYSLREENDTRPIVMVDEDANKLYVFATGKEGGSQICYKELTIPSPPDPLSAMGDFPLPGDDDPVYPYPESCGNLFIEDTFNKNMDNPTSMKRNANNATGIVVLAADDITDQVYAHNVLGDPSPVVDTVSPARGAVNVPLNTTVSATFNKDMNAATITPASFIVEESGGSAVPGIVSYAVESKTAQFTPASTLLTHKLYTVKLTQAIQDAGGRPLGDGVDAGDVRETWQFETGEDIAVSTVQFDTDSYRTVEGEIVKVTVFMHATASQEVKVNYATQNGTAIAGVDYVAKAGTLTFPAGVTSQFFDVVTLDNGILDGSRNLGLVLSNPSGADPGTPFTATIIIEDDDIGIYLPLLIGN